MYEVGERTFRSKEDLRKEASRVLNTTTRGAFLSGDDLDLIKNLLSWHPRYAEKVGCGLRGICVGEGRLPGSRCFWLVRTDGTRTDFSFLKCLAPPRKWTEVQRAARFEVRDQIRAFREAAFRGGSALCALTGVPVEKESCHIDHVVRFETLLQRFLDLESLSADQVVVLGHDDGERDLRLQDRALAARWLLYHSAHAELRVTSAHANLTRQRRETA